LTALPAYDLSSIPLEEALQDTDLAENVEAVTVQDDRPYGLVFRTGDVEDLDVEDLAQKLGQVLLPGSRLPGDTPPVGDLVRERYDWTPHRPD
jgi:hypothetical protein